MHSRHYKVGEYIFCPGDQVTGAAILLNGKVKIKAGDVIYVTLKQGDFFSFIGMLIAISVLVISKIIFVVFLQGILSGPYKI